MPAQRKNAAARPANVAEQKLQDRGGTDVLRSHSVLGPAH